MAKIITIGHILTTSKEARGIVVKAFEDIVEYSRANEPGVSMYAITVPTNDDETTIYMIEEYADKATSDAHIASEPVQRLINLFTSKPVLAGAPTVYQLEPVYSFIKHDITNVKDPYIIFGNVLYKTNGAERSLPHWRELVSTLENDETGSVAYMVCKEEAIADKLHTVEIYQNKGHCDDVHAKDKAVEESIAGTKGLISNLSSTSLRMIGGFLHR